MDLPRRRDASTYATFLGLALLVGVEGFGTMTVVLWDERRVERRG